MKKTKNVWINAKSTKPPESITVLGYCESGMCLVIYWGKGEGWSDNSDGTTIKVTHWALPDPPKRRRKRNILP